MANHMDMTIDSLLDRIESLEARCRGEAALRRAVQVEVDAIKLDRDGWQRRCFELSEENTKLKQELVRRGADHPDKPKPPCDTAFAALQAVCNTWDREERFQDLRKQREEHLRRIRALKSGRELLMNDVVKAMNEDGQYAKIFGGLFPFDLHCTLAELKEQLHEILDETPQEQLHPQWKFPPLHTLMVDVDESEEDSDM